MIHELETLGRAVRIIILKARQEGVSTYIQAKILCRSVKKQEQDFSCSST